MLRLSSPQKESSRLKSSWKEGFSEIGIFQDACVYFIGKDDSSPVILFLHKINKKESVPEPVLSHLEETSIPPGLPGWLLAHCSLKLPFC